MDPESTACLALEMASGSKSPSTDMNKEEGLEEDCCLCGLEGIQKAAQCRECNLDTERCAGTKAVVGAVPDRKSNMP